jgi:hypothetical protein
MKRALIRKRVHIPPFRAGRVIVNGETRRRKNNAKRVQKYLDGSEFPVLHIGGNAEAARTGGATNNYGNGCEPDAIAACVAGGVSNLGGIGTVPGIVIGVSVFSVINYGLTFINMSPCWQQIVKGAIVIAAVACGLFGLKFKRVPESRGEAQGGG